MLKNKNKCAEINILLPPFIMARLRLAFERQQKCKTINDFIVVCLQDSIERVRETECF
jgi:hypothetical protein